MTEREALKLALDALDLLAKYENPSTKIQVRKPRDGGPIVTMYPHKVATDAAALLRERLAQPEQEPVAWRWGVQKLKNGDFEWRYSLNQTRPDAIPLYTTPPQSEPVIDKSAAVRIATALGWEPKRTWRWLTDEEIYEAWDTIIEEPKQAIEFAYNIQAKLKEKNT